MVVGVGAPCWTTTDPNGKYVVNLSEVLVTVAVEWDVFIFKERTGNILAQDKFLVDGVIQKNYAVAAP